MCAIILCLWCPYYTCSDFCKHREEAESPPNPATDGDSRDEQSNGEDVSTEQQGYWLDGTSNKDMEDSRCDGGTCASGMESMDKGMITDISILLELHQSVVASSGIAPAIWRRAG